MSASRLPVPGLLLPALLSLAAPPAAANDASYHGFGAAVFLAREARVRMEAETVAIRHLGAEGGRRPWAVEATFTFRNLADVPVTVRMGHPDWRVRQDGPAGDDAWALADFRVSVDGTDVSPAHQDAIPAPGDAGADRAPPADFRDGAWTWEVAFPPGGVRVVRNTYRFGGVQTNGPYAACVGERPSPDARRAFWRQVPDRRDGWRFDDGLCATATYLVTSGRTWAGPIGRAEVSFQPDPSAPPHLWVPEPAATEIRDGRVVWRFSDWVPDRELSLHRVMPLPGDAAAGLPAFDTVDQARAWVVFARANGCDRATVMRVRAWTAAARDGRYDDPVLGGLAPVPPPGDATARPAGWDRTTRRILRVLDRFAETLR